MVTGQLHGIIISVENQAGLAIIAFCKTHTQYILTHTQGKVKFPKELLGLWGFLRSWDAYIFWESQHQ